MGLVHQLVCSNWEFLLSPEAFRRYLNLAHLSICVVIMSVHCWVICPFNQGLKFNGQYVHTPHFFTLGFSLKVKRCECMTEEDDVGNNTKRNHMASARVKFPHFWTSNEMEYAVSAFVTAWHAMRFCFFRLFGLVCRSQLEKGSVLISRKELCRNGTHFRQ